MERNRFTFADSEIAKKLDRYKDHVLMKIDKMVDWCSFDKILSKVDSRNTNPSGRDCYNPSTMFRIFIIQHYYNLSVRDMEDQLHLNVLYSYFCRISFGSPVPDHSTISRWRDRFIKHNIYEQLLSAFHQQIQEKGFDLRPGNIAIIDATLIESQARPKKKEIIDVEPIGDEELPKSTTSQDVDNNNYSYSVEESNDPDARWVKKGSKSVYGYKMTAIVDDQGLVNNVITTSANISDYHLFEPCLNKAQLPEGTKVLSDKGYDSQGNRDILKKNKLEDGIMRKKPKNAVSDDERIKRNYEISKSRFIVERTFGYLKRQFRMGRSRYIGLIKTHNSNVISALTFNFIRSINLSTG